MISLTSPVLGSSRPITLRATARGYDGQLIAGSGVQNPAEVTVSAGGQIAKLATEIFGAGITGRQGWIELTASEAGVNGFFELFDNALSTLDGGAFPAAPAGRLVFPHVDKDTVLYIVNSGDNAAPAVAVFVYDNNGGLAGSTTLAIGAKAGWSGRVTDLFPTLQAIDGYVVLDTQSSLFSASSDTLVGMQSYERGDEAIVLGQPDFELVRDLETRHFAFYLDKLIRAKLVHTLSLGGTIKTDASAPKRPPFRPI